MAEAPQASAGGGGGTAARAEDYIEVKADKEKATLMVRSSAAKDSVTVTRDTVAAKLMALQVTAGVDWPAVDRILEGKVYDKTEVIAQNAPPGTSRDAWIQEMIKIDPDVKPVLGKDGHADYKNVDNIHQVKKGDVLAVKHPAEQGAPGMDIYGKATPAPLAKDVPFKIGANTEVSADGLQLLAATGGYVFHNAGAICVGVTYTLKGDVDFKTGNLHYQGDIVILGNVTDGFTVEAEGDVTVEGNVDGAEIVSKGGAITVKAAVFGHGKGRLKAKNQVRLQSVQDMDIECEGEVAVDKGLRNCKVAAARIRADKAGCSVVGGILKAYEEIHVAVLGGEGCRTELHIVDKLAEEAREKLKAVEKQRAKLLPALENMEKKLKGMKALAARFGGELSPRARGELKASLDQYAALRGALDGFDKEKDQLVQATNSAARHTGRCVITEKMVWGGYLELYGHPRDLSPEDAPKDWAWTSEGLAGRSILPDPKPSAPPGPTPPADPPA
jgi:uncharacterized protein